MAEIQTLTDTENRALWYVVQTYYNAEKRVKERIDYMANTDKYFGLILRAEIPTVKRTVSRRGKTRQIEEKLFPGYVFVKAILTNSVRSAIKSINGVAGYVGPGGEPTPITPSEVIRAGITDRADSEFQKGDSVVIVDGPFENFVGKVKNSCKKGIKVVLNIFGREVEVSFSAEQLEKL